MHTAELLLALYRRTVSIGLSVAGKLAPSVYAQDGLLSAHNHDFLDDPAFQRAYARGVKTLGAEDTYHWHWRVHTGLWAARAASLLEGDFVECGVNKGFLSSAIMEHLDWNSRSRTFWLLDTFAGLDPRHVTEGEARDGALDASRRHLRTGFYASGASSAAANFAEWRNVQIVEGAVPDTLPRVTAERVAYLHIDMNCAPPEVAALEHFWPRLAPGAPVLLDDYAYVGFQAQHDAMNAWARDHGVAILSLPTGQGLLLKPPR